MTLQKFECSSLQAGKEVKTEIGPSIIDNS